MLRMFTLFNLYALKCHKFTDAKGIINDTEVGLLKFDKKAGL